MFKFKVFIFSLLFAITAMSSEAFAVTLIPYQDEWNYVVVDSFGPSTTWKDIKHDDVDWDSIVWKTDRAGFSDRLSAHPVNRQRPNNNKWPSNTFLLLEKTITYDQLVSLLGEDQQVSDLTISGYLDNAVAVYINGYKIGFTGSTANFTFSMSVSDETLDGIWNHYGDNVFHIIAMDGGANTYFDLQVSSGSRPAPTPIPASVLLLGTGLAGLVGIRRRGSK